MDHIEQCKKILGTHGYSVTQPRLAVFQALLSSSKPLAVSEISRLLPDIDKVSVYRTIDLFEKIGITNRVWNGFKSKLELSEAFFPHHHHLSCLKCGVSIDIEDEEHVDHFIASLADRYTFTPTRHMFEVQGYCSNCAEKS